MSTLRHLPLPLQSAHKVDRTSLIVAKLLLVAPDMPGRHVPTVLRVADAALTRGQKNAVMRGLAIAAEEERRETGEPVDYILDTWMRGDRDHFMLDGVRTPPPRLFLPQTGRVPLETAQRLADYFGVRVDLEEFRKGLEVEREHADVTGDNVFMTARIALAHLREKSNYYTLLLKYVEGGVGTYDVFAEDD